MLVLLVLGLAVKPVLNQLGELHAVEHALLLDADGHGHDHDGPDDDETGADHTQGAHGLMHQASMGGASTDMTSAIALPAMLGGGEVLPPPDVSRVPAQHLTSPFRPPIA